MADESDRPVANDMQPTSPQDISHSSTASQTVIHDQLRLEVEELVRPHTEVEERPPFSYAELIVFALLHSSKQAVEEAEIFEWIFLTFPFFTKRAIAGYIGNYLWYQQYQIELRPDPVHGELFYHALARYDMPLKTEAQDGKWVYKVQLDEARIFLSKYLDPPRKGVFRFLDLPAELRNNIYECLFTLAGKDDLRLFVFLNRHSYSGFSRYLQPRGTRIARGSPDEVRHQGVYSMHRANGSPSVGEFPGHWGYHQSSYDLSQGHFDTERCFKIPFRESISELPFTCKQIYREAMPHFLAINDLHFPSPGYWFVETINKMPEMMFHIVKHIRVEARWGFDAKSAEAQELSAALRKLSKAKSIGTFELHSEDWDWVYKRDFLGRQIMRKTLCKKFAQHEGVVALVVIASKTDKFILEGYPVLAEYIHQEAAQVKAEATEEKAKNVAGQELTQADAPSKSTDGRERKGQRNSKQVATR